MKSNSLLCIPDCVRDGVRFAVPQATERHHIGNQIDAVFVSARAECLIPVIVLSSPRNVKDQCDQQDDHECLPPKLPSVYLAGLDEKRPVSIARKSEEPRSAMRRKHQREHDSKKDGQKCSLQLSAFNHKAPMRRKACRNARTMIQLFSF